MESKRLDNAALAAGISPNYINAHGKPQSIGANTKRRLLDAMHHTAATDVAATPVPNVMIWTFGKKMTLAVEGKGLSSEALAAKMKALAAEGADIKNERHTADQHEHGGDYKGHRVGKGTE